MRDKQLELIIGQLSVYKKDSGLISL
jgi:hypothetical protein